MKLTELFHLERADAPTADEKPMSPSEALLHVFTLLTRGDMKVADAAKDCLADARRYYASREGILVRRGLQYSDEARPWLCVIAAVESAEEQGFLYELNAGCEADKFRDALDHSLAAAGIAFSTDRIHFDPQKNLSAWVSQFNEYAGQSGITLYFVNLYGDTLEMGAADIADYAEAAETAGYAGIKITSRPG